jgi:cytochrome c peroxidase
VRRVWLPILLAALCRGDEVELGRRLFFERKLSSDGSTSCATCHDPDKAFTDGRTVAEGVGGQKGSRNTPTLVNRGAGLSHFWDGRAATLEKQALEPLANPKEQNTSVDAVLFWLRGNVAFRREFPKVFNREVCADDLASALASFVRTIRSDDSRFDLYLKGEAKFNEEETAGLLIFRGKGGCVFCHSGDNFTDERFHNTGVAWRGQRLVDEGRFTVTREEYDRGAFKTPTLRELAHTAPYMHDGSLATLDEVVEYYDRGGNPNPHLDPRIVRLGLSAEEKRSLIAFLKTLSGKILWGPAINADEHR